MSFLETLLGGMYGDMDEPSVDRPCSNCPSSCALAPEQCPACKPYKEKLIDALYQVDHLDEFRAKYEVVDSLPTGATECPHCGAPSGNAFICEYCGMQIQADDGKIRVTSANDIPNPILEAQDIIFERYQAVVQPSAASDPSGDLLGMLASLLLGDVSEQGQATLGSKMTEEEIKEAANMCRVSVSSYLQGLDNGKYPTLPGLKRAATMESRPQGYGYGSSSGMGGMGMGLGAAGLGAAGMAGAMGMGNSSMGGMDSLMSTLMGGNTGYGQQGYPQPGYGQRPPQPPYGTQQGYGNQRPPQYGSQRPTQQAHSNIQQQQQQFANNRINQHHQQSNANQRPTQQQAHKPTTTERPAGAQPVQKPTSGQGHAAGRPNMQHKPTTPPSKPPASTQGKTPKTGTAAPEPPSRMSKWADSTAGKQHNAPTPPPAPQKTPAKAKERGGGNKKGKL